MELRSSYYPVSSRSTHHMDPGKPGMFLLQSSTPQSTVLRKFITWHAGVPAIHPGNGRKSVQAPSQAYDEGLCDL